MQSGKLLVGSALVATLMLPASRPALAQKLAPWQRPTTARLAQRGTAAARVDRMAAEAARLRSDLDRTNAEIETLKRSRGGVRTDFRLRQKMADAEALARRLTEAEADLRRGRGGVGAATGSAAGLLGAAAAPSPQDGPIEFEAKADLLADQARRLTIEADSLARAAGAIRTRQALRRRAGLLERDPFAGLDASRRSMVFARTSSKVGTSAVEGPGKVPPNESGPAADPGAARSPVADNVAPQMGPPAGPPPAPSGSPSIAGGAAAVGAPPSTAPGAGPPPQAPPPTSTPLSPPVAAMTKTQAPPTVQPVSPGTAPSVAVTTLTSTVRTLLDPQTLAEIRRLETSGKPLADVEAMERAAVALRARAEALQAQSRDLRARARP